MTGQRLVFAAAMFTGRHLRELTIPDVLRLAATGDPGVNGFGITTELANTTPYMLSQWWAQALQFMRGLNGLAFEPRHPPGHDAAALFGPRGAGAWPAQAPVELTPHRLTQATEPPTCGCSPRCRAPTVSRSRADPAAEPTGRSGCDVRSPGQEGTVHRVRCAGHLRARSEDEAVRRWRSAVWDDARSGTRFRRHVTAGT